MKILILQLARFGDIYQTWPTIRALRRKFPKAEIDLVVRERYMAAAQEIEEVDSLFAMPTKAILSPLVLSEEGEEDSLVELDRFLDSFKTNYDQIINLSFSPLSSFLVDDIKGPSTLVKGYDRFEDGYLKIADDASAYFYAQVGVGRSNKLHLVDVFAMVADVDLVDDDTECYLPSPSNARSDKPYLLIHVGASKHYKSCAPETWEAVLRVLLKKTQNIIYLVGTQEEKINSSWIGTQNRIVDFCGETSLKDLFPLVSGAEALIACDSMLVQIANLTSTKCLNISFPTVNFWETGPRVEGSRVLLYSSPATVSPNEVCEQLQLLATDSNQSSHVFLTKKNNHIWFQGEDSEASIFKWSLIKAMYMGEDYPVAHKMPIVMGFSRLHELACLGIENIEQLRENPQNQVSLSIVGEIDGLVNQVGKSCSYVMPVVQWFLTEKARIGPGHLDDILTKTKDVFEQLKIVSNLYSLNEELPIEVGRRDIAWK